MKATITFDLTDPSDTQRHSDCLQGQSWRFLVQEVDDTIRSRIKHSNLHDSERVTYEIVRTLIREELEHRNLKLHE